MKVLENTSPAMAQRRRKMNPKYDGGRIVQLLFWRGPVGYENESKGDVATLVLKRVP